MHPFRPIKSRIAPIFAAILAIWGVASCTTDKQVALLAQEEAIDSYIGRNFADMEVVRNEGSSRVIYAVGDGTRRAAAGDSLYVTLEGARFTTSPVNPFLADERWIALDKKSLVEGLYNGIIGMLEGEDAYIFFTSRYGFDDDIVGSVPARTALVYHVQLREIK